MNRQRGELLIVISIILIIAGIAIPNLLKARISANESSAVGSICTPPAPTSSILRNVPQTVSPPRS